MTGTVTHIVVTLAVTVNNLVGAQAILGPYLIVMVPQGHMGRSNIRSAAFSSRVVNWVFSAGLLH